MEFRTAWRRDWKWRLGDAFAHAMLAWILPGPWYFQYIPDLLVPVLWFRSWYYNGWLKEADPVLRVHRVLHGLVLGPALLIVGCVVELLHKPAGTLMFYFGLSWCLHLIVDGFTHEDWKESERASER